MKTWKVILIILFFNLIFYFPVFNGATPLPADNLLAYFPWKFYAPGYQTKGPALFDVMNITYPWKKLAVSEIKQGNFPLWNKYFALGYPYFAAVQGGILYPTTLFFLFLPFNFAWSIHIFLQTFLAGVFMYLLLKSYRLSLPSCLLGSLSFSFSGHFLVWLEYGTLVNAGCWLPLVILLIELAFKKTKPRLLFLISVIMAVSFFAGFPQTTFYILIFSFIYFLLKLQTVKEDIKTVRFIKHGVLSLITFFGLIAVQLLPFLEYFSLSTRNLVNPEKYFSWSVLPTNVISFLLPNFFGHPSKNVFWGRGNYQEFTLYIGLIPLIFFIRAIIKRTVPRFWLVSLTGVLFFLIYNPFLWLFYKLNLPLVSRMAPSRLIILLTFILSVCSSFGFNQFFKEKEKQLSSFFRIITGLFFIFLLAILFYRQRIIQKILNYEFVSVQPQVLSSFRIPFLIIIFLILLIFLKDSKKLKSNLLAYLLIFITIFDLFLFGRDYNPFIKMEEILPKTKTVDFLLNQGTDSRFFSDKGVFPGNYSSLFGLTAINSADTLIPLSLSNYLYLFENDIISSDFQEFLDLVNVKHYLSTKPILLSGNKEVFSDEGIKIYERENFKPRYFFQDGKGEISPVIVAKEDSNKIILSVKNLQDGKIIIGNLLYPGWNARVNGNEAEINEYKEILGQIELNKGKNIIEIQFFPKSFLLGALISLGSLFLLSAYFGFHTVKLLLRRF